MIRSQTVLAFVLGAAIAVPAALVAQNAAAPTPAAAAPVREAEISIYRAAPGKHLDFLKWQAAREAATKDAGVALAQWYVHMDGDAWDYVQITPHRSDADEAKIDAAMKKRKLKNGPGAGIELRALMAWHTDTVVAGPHTLAEILAELK